MFKKPCLNIYIYNKTITHFNKIREELKEPNEKIMLKAEDIRSCNTLIS